MYDKIQPYLVKYELNEVIPEKSQVLYLIRGSSGSGKSTLASFLVDAIQHFDTDTNPAIHLETDARFYDDEGIYNFDASKLSEYHKDCLDATKVSLENGYSVIVSNTFTSEWELKPYVNLAKNMGIPVQVITVQSNFKSIHNVPAKTLQKQKERMKSCDVEKLLQRAKPCIIQDISKYPFDASSAELITNEEDLEIFVLVGGCLYGNYIKCKSVEDLKKTYIEYSAKIKEALGK
jgi:predicted kinase